MLATYLEELETEEERAKMTNLYETHKGAMIVEARKILTDHARSEDAVHDVFMKMTRNLDAVDENDLCRTRSYLCLATRRMAYDMRKGDRRHREVSTEVVEELPGRKVDFLGRLVREELMELIHSLPDIYRDVLELKAYHEFSDKEIAEALGITGATARKRLERARQKLLQEMLKRGMDYAKNYK